MTEKTHKQRIIDILKDAFVQHEDTGRSVKFGEGTEILFSPDGRIDKITTE